MTWEDGGDALFRIYTKSMNGKTIIRKERQEYPNVPFEEAMEEKLSIVETWPNSNSSSLISRQ
jgi:hypothetical protein